jgi:hypothetical protein
VVESTRAHRFSLQLPMKYRPVGHTGWREGTTENISRSGVLFRAPDLLEPNTSVEMRVALPVGPTPELFPQVLCTGRIVRTVGISSNEPYPALAASIIGYRLQQAKINTRD